MNYDTHLDQGLFATMGLFILINTLLSVWLLVAWCRTDAGLPPALVWGIRLGLLMLVLGSIEGVRIVANGGHTVGANDGGAGLPFVNWSTGFGDLRVRALASRSMPCRSFRLLAWCWPQRACGWLWQVSGLFTFAIAYGAVVWWMFAEAMKGVPLVR